MKFGNSFNALEAQINISTNGENYSNRLNISAGDSVFVITDTNYTTDGSKNYTITLNGNNNITSYIEPFKLRGVDILNYSRVVYNLSRQVITFIIRNNWNPGRVNWTLSDPAVSNYSNLQTGQEVSVVIENNYTSQAWVKPSIDARASSTTDIVRDLFENRPLALFRFEALALGSSRDVFELVARNNMVSLQNVSWKLSTGAANITSTLPFNITGDDAFIIIETNYSTGGLYKTNASINSSSYTDSQIGVVVI